MEHSLGEYLKMLRKSFGYTQEFAASHLDISRQEYSHYETNRAVPSPMACRILAHLYEVEPWCLLRFLVGAEPGDDPSPSLSALRSWNDPSLFLEYLEKDDNMKRLSGLSRKEKELIFYYNSISSADQDEILEILKIKLRKNAPPHTGKHSVTSSEAR